MKKILALLLAAMLLATASFAMAEGQVFNFAYTNDLTSLDVSQINDEMSGLTQYAVNEGLVRSVNGVTKNALAETIDVSEDGRTYTFHLRDANWADGKPVTAGEFVYSFLRTMDPATGSSQVEDFADIAGAIDYYSGNTTDKETVGVKAIDDKTLVIELVAANPFFLETLSRGVNFYPIRQDYVEKFGADYGSSPETFIGCGPFVLTEWVKTSSLKYVKNEAYWDAASIALDEVNQLIIADENTSIGMYDAGDVDSLYGISKTYAVLYPEYGTYTADSIQYLCFMTDETSILNNKNLRLALAYGIDRATIANAVCQAGTQVTDRMITDVYMYGETNIASAYNAYAGIPAGGDLEKAKEYLAAALAELGYSDVSELPAIRYVAMESAAHQNMAQALQAQWQQNLGVKVELDVRPVMQAIVGGLLAGDFDVYLVSVSMDVDPATNLNGFTVESADNYAHWMNEEYSKLIDEARFEEDFDVRFTKLAQAENLILSDAAVVPLWVPGGAYVAADYVENLNYGPWTGSMEFIYANVNNK